MADSHSQEVFRQRLNDCLLGMLQLGFLLSLTWTRELPYCSHFSNSVLGGIKPIPENFLVDMVQRLILILYSLFAIYIFQIVALISL